MPSSPENSRDKRPYEQRPQTDKSAVIRKLGETAIKGAAKDQKKGK